MTPDIPGGLRYELNTVWKHVVLSFMYNQGVLTQSRSLRQTEDFDSGPKSGLKDWRTQTPTLHPYYRSQYSTDLHQIGHHGRVPGDVATWKSEIFMSAKLELESIFSIALMEI